MPITPDEWESRSLSLTGAILFILKERHVGWTVYELRVELGHLDRFPTDDEVESVLNDLVRRGRVERLQVEAAIYYRQNRTTGFRPPER
jgi:hypothetical protein